MDSMPPETRDHDGITWIEIKRAAKHSRTKAVSIAAAIEAGAVPSLELDGNIYIPMSAANRLKREDGTMAKVRKLNRVRRPLPGKNPGLLTKEKQEVLPISSGRGGRGWSGQRPN